MDWHDFRGEHFSLGFSLPSASRKTRSAAKVREIARALCWGRAGPSSCACPVLCWPLRPQPGGCAVGRDGDAGDKPVGSSGGLKDSLGMLREFALFGVGLGSWPELFPRYQTPPWSSLFYREAHNDYIELLAETGLVG